MQCKDVMKKDIVSVRSVETVRAAAEKMGTYNVGFVPVCDDLGGVLGTLTDRDIALRCVAKDLPSSTTVLDVMTREVVSCSPDDDVSRALELMSTRQKSRLMCIDAQGKLVGVISLSDLPANMSRKTAGEVLRRVTEREAKAS